MAITAVKKLYCRSCGADVREASAFCYNCGESVSGPHAGEINPTEKITEPEKLIEPQNANAKLQAASDSKAEKLTRLQTASALQRRPRVFKRKPVEVVWVERGDSPPVFVIVSAALTIFSLLLLFLAFYLR